MLTNWTEYRKGGITLQFHYLKRSLWSRVVINIGYLAGMKIWVGRPALVKWDLRRKRNQDQSFHLPVFLQGQVRQERYQGLTVLVINGSLSDLRERVIFYLHGGAYVSQLHPLQINLLLQLAAATGATVLAPVYPLAPRYTCQDAFVPVLRFYRHLLQDSRVRSIHGLGDSAGGGFILALAEELRKQGLEQPQNLILLSPWLDVTMSNPDLPPFERLDKLLSRPALQIYGQAWAGSLDPRHYLVSPLFGDLTGLGKISILVGTHELFLPDCRLLSQQLAARHIDHHYLEYAGQGHVFPILPTREARLALRQITDIVLTGQFEAGDQETGDGKTSVQETGDRETRDQDNFSRGAG